MKENFCLGLSFQHGWDVFLLAPSHRDTNLIILINITQILSMILIYSGFPPNKVLFIRGIWWKTFDLFFGSFFYFLILIVSLSLSHFSLLVGNNYLHSMLFSFISFFFYSPKCASKSFFIHRFYYGDDPRVVVQVLKFYRKTRWITIYMRVTHLNGTL